MNRVSIVTPCYNQGKYLDDALRSCTEQTYPPHEIIVINDGSDEAETELIKSAIAHYRLPITYISQNNSGPAHARNIGYQVATGEFIQFLDADDVLLPPKIARCVERFEANPDVGVVYTDYEIRTNDLAHPAPTQRPAWEMPEGQILGKLLSQVSGFFVPSCALVRREWLERVHGFKESLWGTEDWYLWVAIASHGAPFQYIDTPLVWYRDTPSGISKNHLAMALGRLRAWEALRELPIPTGMLDINQELAARHHVVAMRLWQAKRMAEARYHLKQALRLERRRRAARLALYGLSYFVSDRLADSLMRLPATILASARSVR